MHKLDHSSAIHQVLIVDGFEIPKQLPAMIVSNAEAVKSLYPHSPYKLWSGAELREFISARFDKQVTKAFDCLVPYSYKCDLARYCLLYAFGGTYVDLGVRFISAWDISVPYGIAAFREMYPGMNSWTCMQTSLLWAKPERLEFEIAINYILENCRSQFYGSHDHYPTAGALLGRAFAAAMASKGQRHAADDQWVGEVRYITPERQIQNVCYVDPSKTLIARRTKKAAGDLTETGLIGVNSYVDIFKERRVYGEHVRSWAFDDHRLVSDGDASKTQNGISVALGTIGRVMYGPFVDLAPGIYRVRIAFGDDTWYKDVLADVSADYGQRVLYSRDERGNIVEQRETMSFDFVLLKPARNVEFRLSVYGDFEGHIVGLTVEKITEQRLRFDDSRIGIIGVEKTESGIELPAGTVGRVIYGPYIALDAGRYRLITTFTEKTRFSRLRIEVCWNAGNKLIHVFEYGNVDDEPERHSGIEFEFHLHWTVTDAEFRMEIYGDFDGAFVSYTIKPLDMHFTEVDLPANLLNPTSQYEPIFDDAPDEPVREDEREEVRGGDQNEPDHGTERGGKAASTIFGLGRAGRSEVVRWARKIFSDSGAA